MCAICTAACARVEAGMGAAQLDFQHPDHRSYNGVGSHNSRANTALPPAPSNLTTSIRTVCHWRVWII